MSKRDKVMRASRNERTSARIASIAGRVLRVLEFYESGETVISDTKQRITKRELKALAASALTQAPNKGIVRATARPKKAGRVGRKK